MDRCNPDYKDAEWALYRFAPSMAAAVVFAIMFLLVTIVHVFQMIRTRTWYLTPFCLGGACESKEHPHAYPLPRFVLLERFLMIHGQY